MFITSYSIFYLSIILAWATTVLALTRHPAESRLHSLIVLNLHFNQDSEMGT